MSQNIFNDLFSKLSLNVEIKGNLLFEIEAAQKGIQEIKSLFGDKKIEQQMISVDAIVVVETPFNIIDSLLGYKYRLTHNGHSNSKYNSLNANDTEKFLNRIDKSIEFLLSILFANHNRLKDDCVYGNRLIKIAFNEGLSKDSYSLIHSIIDDLKTDKDLLKTIYWLNMPINGLCREIITQKILDSWTLEDLLLVHRVNVDLLDNYTNKELEQLILKSSLAGNEERVIKKLGSVFYEILDMKLENSKISLSQVAYFMVFCKDSTLFNSRAPIVCNLAQGLVLKIKTYLNKDELDILDSIYSKSNKNLFDIENVMKLSFLNKINKNLVVNLMVSSLLRNNKKSAINVASNLMINYVDEPLELNQIKSLGHNVALWLDLRDSLTTLGVKLQENDIMKLLMHKDISSSEKVKNLIKEWALEELLEREIPQQDIIKVKTLKF